MAQKLLHRWTVEVEWVALEMDGLHGKSFMQLPVVKTNVREANASLTSTSSRVALVEATLARTSCKNNVVTQVALLSKHDYRRQLAHMVDFLAPVKEGQGGAANECTDPTTMRDWLAKQMKGAFMDV